MNFADPYDGDDWVYSFRSVDELRNEVALPLDCGKEQEDIQSNTRHARKNSRRGPFVLYQVQVYLPTQGSCRPFLTTWFTPSISLVNHLQEIWCLV
jgi:hypothetical protein